MLNLKDPRDYSSAYPKSNLLINQASFDLQNNTNLLPNLIKKSLTQQQDQLINVACNLAPNHQLTQHLIHSLSQALNSGPNYIYAIPVVLVIGNATNNNILSNQLDTTNIYQLLVNQEILSLNDIWYPHLYCGQDLAAIKPSIYYQITQNQVKLNDYLNLSHHTSKLQLGAQVELRYLVFQSTQTQLDWIKLKNLNHEIVSQLSQTLTTDTLSILALTFEPKFLDLAISSGGFHVQEISLMLNLSNLLREVKKTTNKELKIKINSLDSKLVIKLIHNTQIIASFDWIIYRGDDFSLITKSLAALFTDLRLNYETND